MKTFKLKKYEERFKVLFYLEAAYHYDMAVLNSELAKTENSKEEAEETANFINFFFGDKNNAKATPEEFIKKSSDYAEECINEYNTYKMYRDCGYISQRTLESFSQWYAKDPDSGRSKCYDLHIMAIGRKLLSLEEGTITKEQYSEYMLWLTTNKSLPISFNKGTIIILYLMLKAKIKEIEGKISERTT